jgi:Fe2+ transport system protein FeoA
MKSKTYLSAIKAGSFVKIVSIEAGQNLANRLATMGLLPGVKIKVVNNSHPGPFVVEIKGSKVALGRGMAGKIVVSEQE